MPFDAHARDSTDLVQSHRIQYVLTDKWLDAVTFAKKEQELWPPLARTGHPASTVKNAGTPEPVQVDRSNHFIRPRASLAIYGA
jgi:hypothetical protein